MVFMVYTRINIVHIEIESNDKFVFENNDSEWSELT